jgi:hypothetical protein
MQFSQVERAIVPSLCCIVGVWGLVVKGDSQGGMCIWGLEQAVSLHQGFW